MLEKIRRTVSRIPRGFVATYGQVAAAAGFPGRARQVVWALNHAGGALPWHRVVGAGGKILLTAEQGLEQRLRLESEGITFTRGRVRLDQHEYNFRSSERRKRTSQKL